MTQEEREKLIEEMTKVNAYLGMAHALAIAEVAFERKIQEAYKEGWQEARDISSDPNDWEIDWQESNALATILAEKP